MPQPPSYPGVYVKETGDWPAAVPALATADTVFVGRTPLHRDPRAGAGPWQVHGLAGFEHAFGTVDDTWTLGLAVRDFFAHGGTQAWIVPVRAAGETDPAPGLGAPLQDADYLGDAAAGSGLHAIGRIAHFGLLCVPPDVPGGDTTPAVWQAALATCVQRRAMLLVDPPAAWDAAPALPDAQAVAALGLRHPGTRNAALYFPRLRGSAAPDAPPRAPCGAVAGVYARTDARRGVWKAPAGTEAVLRGVVPVRLVDDDQHSLLNPLAVNCLRRFPEGVRIWGARTLAGADAQADDFKYVPVRRLALLLEASLARGLGWTAFESNGETLWERVRLASGAFMQGLFRQGAFQGTSPREAYFVKCGASTTTAAQVASGACGLVVGFAPLKPAEFTVIALTLQARAPGA